MHKSKVGILSLGCPRNLVDSENILGRLEAKGYRITDIQEADVAIVNTCSFIEDAKVESIDAILDLIQMKKEGKLKKIIVYGCLPQRYKDKLGKQLPEVDVFVGKVSLNHSLQRYSLTPRHYAYLKICEGCVNNCSYCVIPKIKGAFSSISMEDVLKRARELDGQGVRELNIIGQDITGYGMDLYKRMSLASLVKKISKNVSQVKWIRLLYLYPTRISDGLLDLINGEPLFCKYIDVPVQHISERILKLMRRQTSRKDILRTIERIRGKVKGVALRTSLIVGFPSETDKEFKELLEFVREARFERLGVFAYSREEATPAHDLKKQIPKKVKEERLGAVMSLQQDLSCELNRRFIGQNLDVLIDERQGQTYLGRTQYDAPEVDGLVYVRSKRKFEPGDLVRASITDTMEYDLAAEA